MEHSVCEGWAARRQLSVKEGRKQLQEIGLAANLVMELFDDIDTAVNYGQLLKFLCEGANSTACRMDDFIEWLQVCKILEWNSNQGDESIVSLNMNL